MPGYKTKAISLKTAPFGEADKLVTLFSHDQGKIKAIAKGARKIPSRLSARVEPFTYGDYFIIKGRNLDIISECQTIETFQKIRENSTTLRIGFYFLKIIDSATVVGEANVPLFNLLLKFLSRLKNRENLQNIISNFERNFAKVEGIRNIEEYLEEDLRKWKI